MNKFEQLIKELCPNGVEYKKLSDIATVARGVRVVRDQLAETGEIPVYQNSIKPLGYHDKSNVKAYSAFVIGAGAAGEIGFSDVDFWAADDCYYFLCPDNLNNRYLYFVLMKNQPLILSRVRKASIPRLSRTVIENLVIPVPPLEVQAEIVKILDEYTESVTALQQELEAELTARKKQYEYYRDLLLDFGVHGGGTSDCEWRTLKEIAENCDSKRKPVTKSKRTSGIYPYYGASGIVDYVDNYLFDGDYLLISEDGANLLARSTPIAFSISGKNWVNNHAHVLHFDTYVTRRFVEIYLNSINLEKYISTAAQPKLTQDNLNKIPIPYPSMEEQTRIVSILDRFDKLCNDISEGLPAEIEARRKQYEYYRDKLLSFEEVKA